MRRYCRTTYRNRGRSELPERRERRLHGVPTRVDAVEVAFGKVETLERRRPVNPRSWQMGSSGG